MRAGRVRLLRQKIYQIIIIGPARNNNGKHEIRKKTTNYIKKLRCAASIVGTLKYSDRNKK